MHLPKLRRLNLIENEIASVEDFEGHLNLEILELGKNKLKNTDGLGRMPQLKVFEIYFYLGTVFVGKWNEGY